PPGTAQRTRDGRGRWVRDAATGPALPAGPAGPAGEDARLTLGSSPVTHTVGRGQIRSATVRSGASRRMTAVPPAPTDEVAPPPRPAGRPPAPHLVALAAAVVSSVVLVAVAPRHGGFGTAIALCATVSGGAVAVLEHRSPRLGARVIAVA